MPGNPSERFAKLHKQFVRTFEQFKDAKTHAERRKLLKALRRILDESQVLLRGARLLK
jgi:hypothetical protein